MNLCAIATTALFLLQPPIVEAALIRYAANGVDLVYDSSRDLTWVADAKLFRSQYLADSAVTSEIIATVATVTSSNGTHMLAQSDFNDFGITGTPPIFGRMSWYGAIAWAQWLGRGKTGTDHD
jgi:hypothetical protein